jgi:hypothetical protein
MISEYTHAYHFLPAVHALTDLRDRQIKVSVFDAVNDPHELRAYILEGIPENVNNDAVQSYIDRYCLLCLGPAHSNPIMWQRYAGGGTGICLGLDIKTSLLRKINYVDEVQVASFPAELVEACFRVRHGPKRKRPHPVEKRAAKLLEPFLTTKFRTFKAESGELFEWFREEELRAFVTKVEEKGGHYFADFGGNLCVKEVILGPNCKVPVERIHALVENYPHRPIDVRQMTSGV